MQDADSIGAWACLGVWGVGEFSVLPTQFFCEPKTALKIIYWTIETNGNSGVEEKSNNWNVEKLTKGVQQQIWEGKRKDQLTWR